MDTWKISKTGTTYRFLQRWSENGVPNNTTFCQYYSLLAINILKVFAFALTIPGLFTVALFLMGFLKVQPFTTEFWFYFTIGLFGIAVMCLLAGWMVVGFVWVIYMFGPYVLRFFHKVLAIFLWAIVNVWIFVSEKMVKKSEKPSFIRTWLRSKKEKFCPIVEFTDED